MANHIAAIHVLKGQLQLTDDDYRVLLKDLVGQTSSKACTAAQQQTVRQHMQRLAERRGLANPARRAQFLASYKEASPRERKIWALWKELGRQGFVQHADAHALNAWVKRQVGVDALRFCTPPQLDTLIEALKAWKDR